jgi:hypothetical protein
MRLSKKLRLGLRGQPLHQIRLLKRAQLDAAVNVLECVF